MGKNNVETPLLKAYLRSVQSYPDYMPSWITAVGWTSFVVLTLYLAVVRELACIGTAIAGGIAYGLVTFLRAMYKPANRVERSEEVTYGAVRRLKKIAAESNIQKRIPAPVLMALEEAVEARNTALARLAVEDPVSATEATRTIDHALHACFVAVGSVIRDDEHSRREWEALQAKSSLVNEIVEAIHQQTHRMKQSVSPASHERIAALRELELIEPTDLHHHG